MSRYRPEERQADPRPPQAERVMQALMQAPGNELTLRNIQMLAGLTAEQVLRVLDRLVTDGTVRPLGDLRYRAIARGADA